MKNPKEGEKLRKTTFPIYYRQIDNNGEIKNWKGKKINTLDRQFINNNLRLSKIEKVQTKNRKRKLFPIGKVRKNPRKNIFYL